MKPDKGNNKKNTWGIVSLILWALILTLLLKSCTSSYTDANEVQVDYSTFKQWVEEDKVDRVLMQSGKYTITLREGVTVDVPVDESAPALNLPWLAGQEQETVYITVPTPETDLGIYDLMDAHGTEYYDCRWTPPI